MCVQRSKETQSLKSKKTVLPNIIRCGHQPAVSMVLWLRRDKFTQTTKSCGGKGTAQPLFQEESTPTLALTDFYCFSGHITLRMILIYCAQVYFRWLPFTENKGIDVANYIKEEYLQIQREK